MTFIYCEMITTINLVTNFFVSIACSYNFFVFNKGITLHLFFLVTVLIIERKFYGFSCYFYAVDYHVYTIILTSLLKSKATFHFFTWGLHSHLNINMWKTLKYLLDKHNLNYSFLSDTLNYEIVSFVPQSLNS